MGTIRRETMGGLRCLAMGLALALAFAAPMSKAAAEGEAPGVLSAIFENDVFLFEDDNYTTGIQISYVSGADRGPRWLRRAVEGAGLLAAGDRLRWELGAGQQQYTPEATGVAEPLPDQHPYAAWLYATAAIYLERPAPVGAGASGGPARLTKLQANLGVVGPSALGEAAQNAAHSVFGIDRVRGWDNQLRDEPAFQFIVEQRSRRIRTLSGGRRQVSFEPHATVSLGNALTYAAGGATVRWGGDLSGDYGPPRLRPGASGAPFFEATRKWNGYLFAGAEARGVVRNIFLDGNTFRRSLSVDKRPLTGDLYVGAVGRQGRVQISANYVYRLKEFDGQEEPDSFLATGLQLAF
ncbi:MAG: lipid A deacylase LpxR family protein [Pseudomonadota bacterium]